MNKQVVYGMSLLLLMADKVYAVDIPGPLELNLDTLGVTPITLPDEFTIDPDAQVVVDGTDYEGLDGYFPLIYSSRLSESSDLSNVVLTGFDSDRKPGLVLETGSLWMRLTAPPAFSQSLCSLVPDSTVIADYASTEISASRELEPTVSAWAPTFHEAHVMDTQLSQTVLGGGAATDNLSWQARVGRGGHLYSLRIPSIGETVPPSWRRDDVNASPWNDEVWQGVAVDTALNNASDSKYFIHQSGVYMKDPILEEPFYSPQVAANLDVVNRSFTTINWGQHAHVGNYTNEDPNDDFQSHLLYYTRYRDLGQGVVEVSLGFYNYGTDNLNHFNMPWGGVRRTSTEYAFLSESDGVGWSDALQGNFGDGLSANYADMGGTIAFCASETGDTPALGLVLGFDPNTLLDNQLSSSRLRYGYAGGAFQEGEADWRNYFVISAIRKYYLSQGRGVWARYYYVLGDDLDDISSRISLRGLAENATLSEFEYTEAETPLIGYTFTGSGTDFRIEVNNNSPQFLLYAHPVTGSFPIYEIIENDYSRHLTWNPYATGVIKTYDGTIAGIRLLGFALRGTDVGSYYTYSPLTDVMSDVPENYFAAGEDLFVCMPFVPAVPVAHWSFDDGTGTTVSDTTGNGYNGTATGGTWTDGVNGRAMSFNGGADKVTLPTAAFRSIDDKISISMWVYGSDLQPVADSVFYASASGARALNIHLPFGNSNVYWDAGSVTYDRIVKTADQSQFKGRWNHWVFTKNATAGNMKIYHNGTLWHSGAGKTKTMAGITAATISHSRAYHGMIDDVKLYNVELSTQDAAALFDDKLCDYYLAGDRDFDCKVDIEDFAFMAIQWLANCDVACDAALDDLVLIAETWLVNCTTEPGNLSCIPMQ